MTYAADVPPTRRAATLATVAVIHIAAILFLAATRSPSATPAVARSLTIISLAHDATAAAPPPSLPSKRPAEKRVDEAPSLSRDTEPTTAQAGASGCATFEQVSKTIVADSAAVAAVIQAPSTSRSVADAIVIWNAGWSGPTATADAPLEPVREAVVQSLVGLDQKCLDEKVIGPRFVPVPDGERTVLLVFGSGSWNWKELLDDDNVQSASPTDQTFTGE